MLLIFVTFLLTTALYVVPAVWAIRRVSKHLQQNPNGVQAVTEHVLIPLLGRRRDDESEQEPGQSPAP